MGRNGRDLPLLKFNVTVVTFLVTLLVVAFVLVPSFVVNVQASSTETSFQDVPVDVAYNMVTESSDLVILDVRNQSEYGLGHLYDAVLIPYHELEARISELEEYKDQEILVYCKSGGRSELASGLLAENNFTQVYNMVGGILVWTEAGYPIYTTAHYGTVDVVDEEILFEMEPLLLHQAGCTSCVQNQSCPSDNEPANTTYTSTVLEEGDNYTVTQITYEVNGTTYEAVVNRTQLWNWNRNTYFANRTASFISTEVTSEGMSTQFYSLNYQVQREKYNLTVGTRLTPLDSETYNVSSTVVNYAPAGKSEVTSLEFVEFNSSVTLSQQYDILGKVAGKIGTNYLKNGLKHSKTSLMKLDVNYYRMGMELKRLSWLIEQQLPQEYDKEILNTSALLVDPEPLCTICQELACPLLAVGTCWGVCWLYPAVCAYCATLIYYYDELGYGCDVACQLTPLCT